MTLKGTLIGRSLRCEDEGDCGEVLKMSGDRTGDESSRDFGREI